MRLLRVFFGLGLILMMSRPSAGAVIAVRLPGLEGVYLPTPGGRNVTFQLPALPSAIRRVSVHVRGTTTFALFNCDSYEGFRLIALPTITEVQLFANPGWWQAFTENTAVPGSFEWTRTLTTYSGAAWDFLLDGSGEIIVSTHGDSAIPECYPAGPPADLSIDEFTLLIDGDFPTPAVNASWGRIKSIYR